MSTWTVRLPGMAEAGWLAGDCGPLGPGRWGQRPPGKAEILSRDGQGVAVRLDQAAYDTLAHLGTVSGDRDGRITYQGDMPVMHIGGAAFPVEEDPDLASESGPI